MPVDPRMTMQVQAILRVFLSDPAQRRYGLELCEATELPSGTVHPVLARLERIGWLDGHWEEPGAHADAGRPRRRYYTITPDGAEKSRDAIARTYASRHRSAPEWLHRPGPAGGAS
ncbi:PadR family transcriptional regulator [Planomonospora corallina]|uniref:PadR family transcriptional regulator n=1 Tax=Planomonospora corallina TaxID=1806052 RepID=A0ABV8IEQ5_9ACTN